MAHLVISDHPLRGEGVCRYLISTILLFGIITCAPCGAVSEQKEGKTEKDNFNFTIPRGCQHVVSGEEKIDQGSNNSLQTQFASYGELQGQVKGSANDESRDFQRIVDFEIGDRLNQCDFLTFTAQEGPLSALKGSRRRIYFRLLSWSKTVYNELYLVTGELIFMNYEKAHRESPSMTVGLEGVFSNQTGLFCSTGCVGAPRRTNVHQETDQRYVMTPAKFAYMVEHPESDSFPDSLVERDCEVHVELQLPRAKTIKTSLVTGVMESLRSQDDPSYFPPLSISGISELPYEYDSSAQNEAHILREFARPDIPSGIRNELEVWSSDPPFCDMPRWTFKHDLHARILLAAPIWNSSCLSSEGRRCSPFLNLNISRIVDSEMRIRDMQCNSDLRISAAFEFAFTQYTSAPTSFKDNSNETFTTLQVLVAEGFWTGFDGPGQKRAGQLVMVAHYLASDGTPLDTRIEITLQLPVVQTLHHRFGVIGHVRSTRKASDTLYFPHFTFVGNFYSDMYEFGAGFKAKEGIDWESLAIFNPSYNYDRSIIPRIQPVCSLSANSRGQSHHRNARFPDGSRAADLEFQGFFPFDMIPGPDTSFPSGMKSSHLFANLFIGQKRPQFCWMNNDVIAQDSLHSMVPVSFRYITPTDLLIEMEGYYDSAEGHLCLLGCRQRWEDVAAAYENDDIRNLNASQTSCNFVLSIQYPPTNLGLLEKHPSIVGIVASLLDAGHPLYFKPLQFFSELETTGYFIKGVSRGVCVVLSNLETIISLGPLSFTTFIIAVQAGHSTRESSFKTLRYLSLVMVTILTSGDLFRLLRSFNGFGTKPLDPINRVTSSFSGFNGWPETHKLIMRGTSMVALLLELRLQQLVRRSRSSAKTNPVTNPLLSTAASSRTVSDVRVLLTCVPVYATKLLMLEFVQWTLLGGKRGGYTELWAFLWPNVQAFSEIIVDLFLLPQVIGNVLWDTQKRVAPLHPVFYKGMTVMRSTQHFLRQDSSNPNWSFYSTGWSFIIIRSIIPCCSVILATLLFLQQRYGGQCFIPKRLRRKP